MSSKKTNPGRRSSRVKSELDGVTLDGRYLLNSPSRAEGGMSEIWNATDLKLGSSCLVKLLPPDLAKTEAFVDALMREAKLTAALRAEAVAPIIDRGVCKGVPYFVMDEVSGISLADYLDSDRRRNGMNADSFLAIFKRLVGTVSNLHKVQVIHRDLKPENILIKTDRAGGFVSLCVIDFGIAQSNGALCPPLDESLFKGTPRFIPPEHVVKPGSRLSSESVDVFALGMIGYRMLLGKSAFNKIEFDSFYQSKEELPLLHEHPIGEANWVNEDLGNLLAKCVDFDPSERPPDAIRLLQELNKIESFDPSNIPFGTVVDDHFRILSPLSHGAMGSVYCVENIVTESDKDEVLKILAMEETENTEDIQIIRERFNSEKHTLISLNHPSIPDVWQSGRHRGHPFYVMEKAEGEVLSTGFEKLHDLGGWGSIIRSAYQIADALDYAHEQGVIHRDVKPDNIIVDLETEKTVVLDFGVAFVEKLNLTGLSIIIGTPGFSAPELQFGNCYPESDQWSLAACFYYLLTGKLPGQRESDDSSIKMEDIAITASERIAEGGIVPISEMELSIETPAQILVAINKALSANRKDRFKSVRGFIRAMAASVPESLSGDQLRDTGLSSIGAGRYTYAETHKAKSSKARVYQYLAPAFITGVACAFGGYFIATTSQGEQGRAARPESFPLASAVTKDLPEAGAELIRVKIRAEENGKPVEGIEILSNGVALTLPTEKLAEPGTLLATVVDTTYSGFYNCDVSKDFPDCLLRLERSKASAVKTKRTRRSRKPSNQRVKLNNDNASKRSDSPFIFNPAIKDK